MQEDDLEWLSKLADARLGVAEELGWYAAIAIAVAIGLKLEWWAGVVALYPVYYVVTLQYRKTAERAEDAYFRHAKIGRYGYLRQETSSDE